MDRILELRMQFAELDNLKAVYLGQMDLAQCTRIGALHRRAAVSARCVLLLQKIEKKK